MSYQRAIATLPCPNLAHVREFFCINWTALVSVSHILGGPSASARVFLLREAVQHTRRLTDAQSSLLVDFHRLLTLHHVGDLDRIESGLFAQIDPASGFVDECCLLSERLGALLLQIAENDPVNAALCEVSQEIPKVA